MYWSVTFSVNAAQLLKSYSRIQTLFQFPVNFYFVSFLFFSGRFSFEKNKADYSSDYFLKRHELADLRFSVNIFVYGNGKACSPQSFFPIAQQPNGPEAECRTAIPAVRVRFPAPANIFEILRILDMNESKENGI